MSKDYDWTKSLIRVIAAAALSYPATYASRESSNHRRMESLNRKIELELASIEPFIELLSEEKKQKIKEDLVSKYFGNNLEFRDDSNGKNEEIPISAFDRIIKAIIPLIKK